MAKIIPLNQPAEQIVLAYVNQANNLSLGLSDIEFGAPLDTPGEGFNTQIKITAAPDSLYYTGEKDVKYSRLDIGTLFKDQVALVTGHIYDTDDTLALLNPEFGIAIDATSVFPATIDADGYVTLKIKDDLVYTPNSTLRVMDEFDWSLNRLHNLIHVDLAGSALPAL